MALASDADQICAYHLSRVVVPVVDWKCVSSSKNADNCHISGGAVSLNDRPSRRDINVFWNVTKHIYFSSPVAVRPPMPLKFACKQAMSVPIFASSPNFFGSDP